MRIDDFKNAIKLSAQNLKEKNPRQIANLAGASYDEALNQIKFKFCGREIAVTWPEVDIHWVDEPEAEFPLTDGVLVLHYLEGAQGVPMSGDLVAFRQIPGGEFYAGVFSKRAEHPLAATFGNHKALFEKAALKFEGEPISGYGDWGAKFVPLPLLPIILSGYEGDEEFEASGQIHFDKNIQHYLPAEDIVWMASTLVYRLMGYARQLS